MELISNDRFDGLLAGRLKDPVFAKRPLLTMTLDFLHQKWNFPPQLAWSLINIGCIGLIIHQLHVLGKNFAYTASRTWSGVIFLSSYPILFCATTQLFGFDDFLQWALLLSAFNAKLNGKMLLMAVLFGLSIICRETSLLMLPLFLYAASSQKIFDIPTILALGFAVIAALIFIAQLGNNDQAINFILERRFGAIRYNFSNLKQTVLSLVSLAQVFLPLIVLLTLRERNTSSERRSFLRLLVLTTALFTIVATFTSLLKENRILALPMLFFIPFMAEELKIIFKKKDQLFSNISTNQVVILVLSICFLTVLCFFWYVPAVRKSAIIYQSYTFLMFLALLLIARMKYSSPATNA